MKHISLSFFSIVFLALTAFFFWIFFERFFLDYNSEGRYQDQNSGVVYEQQSLIGYGLLACTFTFITSMLLSRLKKKLS